MAAGAVLLTCLVAGCGEKEESIRGAEPESVELMLDFFVNPDHAGIYAALENGHFEEAGLDVTPRVPSDPSAPIKLVATGKADLAVSYEPEVLLARDQGLPVVAVASLVSEPLTSLISLPDAGIAAPADLRDKTIATAGIPYQDAFLGRILRDARIGDDEVEQVSVGLGLEQAVLSGKADAMLGGFRNIEGVSLEERGENPRVVPADELGIPTYDELVLVANTEQVSEDPEPIRLFIAALERGTQDAIDDPGAATDSILKAGDGLDPKLTEAEVEATLPLLNQPGRQPFGYMDEAEWNDFAGFLAEEGFIQALPEPGEAFTNDLLPGEVPE
ncbi:MAG: ABC transporter substrate-binding protein [Solirubrobacterales bacterium]